MIHLDVRAHRLDILLTSAARETEQLQGYRIDTHTVPTYPIFGEHDQQGQFSPYVQTMHENLNHVGIYIGENHTGNILN